MCFFLEKVITEDELKLDSASILDFLETLFPTNVASKPSTTYPVMN